MESVPERPVIEARLKLINQRGSRPPDSEHPGHYKVLCGLGWTYGTAPPCSGVLGTLNRFSDGYYSFLVGWSATVQRLVETDEELIGQWFVWSDDGLRRDQDGVFRSLATFRRKRKPRRPMNAALFDLYAGEHMPRMPGYGPRSGAVAQRDRVIFGDVVLTPAVIECSQCHFLNAVVAPELPEAIPQPIDDDLDW